MPEKKNTQVSFVYSQPIHNDICVFKIKALYAYDYS